MAAKELDADVRRMRVISRAAVVIWTSLAGYDVLQASRPEVGHLTELLTIRAAGTLLLLGLSVWAQRDARPTRFKLDLGVVLAGVLLNACLSLMCLCDRAFESSTYNAGIVLVTFAMICVPRPLEQGALVSVLVFLPYTFVLLGSSALRPEQASGLGAPHALAAAIQFHFVGLASGAFVAVLSHSLWAMRRELYESQSVGRYRLSRALGQGAEGEVWAAYHRDLRRELAVKILHRAVRDAKTRARYERELCALAGLSHPNIVRLYDFGISEDGRPYYAMEPIEGESLRGLIEREGRLPVERARDLIAQAARALAEAHRRGIAHGAAKPANMFVSRDDDRRDLLKVGDFAVVSLGGVSLSESARAWSAGIPTTTSPERLLGAPASAAADVYALGAVFYLLLTGELPSLSENGRERVAAPSAKRGERLPELVDAIVLRCLERDPARRYRDAGELARALEACSTHYYAPARRALAGATWPSPEPESGYRWKRDPLSALGEREQRELPARAPTRSA